MGICHSCVSGVCSYLLGVHNYVTLVRSYTLLVGVRSYVTLVRSYKLEGRRFMGFEGSHRYMALGECRYVR